MSKECKKCNHSGVHLLKLTWKQWVDRDFYECLKCGYVNTFPKSIINELRDEIIRDLNDRFKFNCEFKDGDSGNVSIVRNSKMGCYYKIVNYYDKTIYTYETLPLKLAHKITTYFVLLEEENARS